MAYRSWIFKIDGDTITSRGVKVSTDKNFRPGGVEHNAFDVDADGNYLFLAVKNSSSQPEILKMKADLSADAASAFNPGAGSEVNLMAGDLSPYWVWASGDFGGTIKVIKTTDGGSYWYTQNENTWSGVARPALVGPGDDTLFTTSTDLTFFQNRYEGDTQYWIDRSLSQKVWALDRVDVNFDQVILGSYWYSNNSDFMVYYSPNSGLNWKNVTDSFPDNVNITALIVG